MPVRIFPPVRNASFPNAFSVVLPKSYGLRVFFVFCFYISLLLLFWEMAILAAFWFGELEKGKTAVCTCSSILVIRETF